MIFPVVMYGCESWTIKKIECLRIGAFELWCWRRLLRVPRTTRRLNQSVLKEIRPDYSMEGMMLKLIVHIGHLMRRTESLHKTRILGKIEGGRRGQQRMRWLDGITDAMDMSLVGSGSWWWTERPGMLQSMGLQRHDRATELNCLLITARGPMFYAFYHIYSQERALTVFTWSCFHKIWKYFNCYWLRSNSGLNITHYQRNANQNHNEVPLHASQDGCYPKVYKQ